MLGYVYSIWRIVFEFLQRSQIGQALIHRPTDTLKARSNIKVEPFSNTKPKGK